MIIQELMSLLNLHYQAFCIYIINPQQIMTSKLSSRRRINVNRSSLSVIDHNPQSAKIHFPSLGKVKRHQTALSSYRLIDYSMQKVKYKASPQKYLSSKIDFFNSQNQRKLDVSKQKILIDIGVIPMPKPKLAKVKTKYNLPPSMHMLVQKYFRFKEMRSLQEEDYMVIGPDNKLYQTKQE